MVSNRSWAQVTGVSLYLRAVKLLFSALILSFFANVPVSAHAQSFQLSGYIQDAASGEMLLGATLWCEAVQAGTGTNAFGFYSIALPAGKHQLTVSYIGYTPQTYEIDVNKNLKLDFELNAGVAIDEAVVTGEGFNRIEDQVQMSKVEIPMDQVRRLPAIGGEVDLLKSLQLMPGIQSGGEGTSGLYVRGGSPDQNLIVLDLSLIHI